MLAGGPLLLSSCLVDKLGRSPSVATTPIVGYEPFMLHMLTSLRRPSLVPSQRGSRCCQTCRICGQMLGGV